ncbi:MAG: dihydroneopterin aldolase [Leeuwenhoekiella sp.]
MGIIRLNNIRTYSYHGCLVEESKIGSDYKVDLKVWADLKNAAISDKLGDTVDYVHLNKIVKEEMAIPSKLLEEVCQRIINRSLEEIPMVSKLRTRVAKLNPPINGDVASVSIEMTKKR